MAQDCRYFHDASGLLARLCPHAIYLSQPPFTCDSVAPNNMNVTKEAPLCFVTLMYAYTTRRKEKYIVDAHEF